ncbi:MAG: RdgB/HAM1 family non-canonical purine NTP pyrophosphatase, partial [Flavobacteriales bacterium]|nr:RdgB/HAM1 family non-canonical purine NTP pyrophosphatase [Flavobacteriales bacterium]
TLEENALEKARHVHQLSGLPCMADDTGLEVDALDGRPGVRSARYAGSARDPQQNMAKLLEELAGEEERGARFRTVIAFVDSGEERCFEGEVRGHIADRPSGEHGFGYDPVFIPEGGKVSFAEMDDRTKNAISHRGRAVAKFLAHYRQRG